MTRTITFTDTDEGRRRFKLIWDGFRVGTIGQKERSPETMRQEASVRQSLKTISTNGGVEGDADGRDLQAGGGSVSLDQPLVKLITTYGWSVQWMPTAVEDAIDALDFVDASPETKDDA